MAHAVGALLKTWRAQRRRSQLELAGALGTSPRHLSFIESGRSQPSEDMVRRLAEELKLSPVDQNRLLVAAGFAPRFAELGWDHPALAEVRQATQLMLSGHHPNPGFVFDSGLFVLSWNDAAEELLRALGVAPSGSPPNLLEWLVDGGPLASAVTNRPMMLSYLSSRLREAALYRGPESKAAKVLERYANRLPKEPLSCAPEGSSPRVLMTLDLQLGEHTRRFFSTVTTFGGPLEACVEEITIELFYPAG